MPDDFADSDPVALQTTLLQYRASLFDPVTQLPTLAQVIDRVRRMLDERETVLALVIRIEQEQSLETMVGWERYDTLLRAVADYLREILSVTRRDGSVLCQDNVRSDVFLLVVADRRDSTRLLGLLSEPITVAAQEDFEPTSVTLRIGQGTIRRRPAQRLERCIYSGIAQAREDFDRRGEALDEHRRSELHKILRERSITTLFQPIFRMPQRTVVGYEALSRGPAGSYLEPAENLFGFTQRAGLLGEVEQLCVERALSCAHRLPLGATVFLNLSFVGLEHLESEGRSLAALVRQAGWSPREFVLEITERTFAESPELVRQRVRTLRQQGFRIAIDDMGTGYSSLNAVADLQPDYIKLDQLLVRDLAHEPIKRNLVSAITGFAHTSQALVIAEGVERQEEASVLQTLGVFLLQGFFLGYPKAF